jgi:hypothetical protein
MTDKKQGSNETSQENRQLDQGFLEDPTVHLA